MGEGIMPANPDYSLLARPSGVPEFILAQNQNYRQNQLLKIQMAEEERASKAAADQDLYRQELSKFLGQDTVNTLMPMGPGAPAPQPAPQNNLNALMRLNPTATMQFLQAQGQLQAQHDAARERQAQEEHDAALRAVRWTGLVLESKAPGRLVKTQHPEMVAQLQQQGVDTDAMTDDDWRARAQELHDQAIPLLDPRFGMDPGAELEMRKAAQGISQREIAAREKELALREKGGAVNADLLDDDTLNLAVIDVMADPTGRAMLNYARYKSDAPKRTQINKEIARRLKDANMTPGDLVKLRAEGVGTRKSISDQVKQLNAINNFETLAKFNGQRVLELIDELDDTGVPWIEGLTRRIKRGGGNVDAAELNAVLVPFQTEVARITNNPNLTGVLSDSARHEVQEMSAGNMSAKQAKRVINRLFTEMDVRKASIQNGINTAGTSLIDRLPGAQPPQAEGAGVVNWSDLK